MDYKIFLQSIPQLDQRQDSLYNQMKDTIPILNKFGFYDVTDMIKEKLKNMD